jgi:hypothetical protein
MSTHNTMLNTKLLDYPDDDNDNTLSAGALCVLTVRLIISLRVPKNTYLRIQMISIIITRNVSGNRSHKVIQLMTLGRGSHYAGMSRGRPVPFPVVAIPICLMTTRSSSCTTTFSGRRLDATSSPHDSHSTQYDATRSYCHTHHNACVHRTKSVEPSNIIQMKCISQRLFTVVTVATRTSNLTIKM